jgi:hemerythrin-like domain-containing protein
MKKTPLQILSDEHEVILGVLAKIPIEGISDPAIVQDLLRFCSQFADINHHLKEEKIVFPKAQEKGILKEGGPIGMMLFEHEQGRELVQEMRKELSHFPNNGRFNKKLMEYRSLLRQHIQKEEEHIFPACAKVFSDADNDAMLKLYNSSTDKKEYEDLLLLANKLILKLK